MFRFYRNILKIKVTKDLGLDIKNSEEPTAPILREHDGIFRGNKNSDIRTL